MVDADTAAERGAGLLGGWKGKVPMAYSPREEIPVKGQEEQESHLPLLGPSSALRKQKKGKLGALV